MSSAKPTTTAKITPPPQSESILAWAFVPHRDNPKHQTLKHAAFSLTLMTIACLIVCTLLSNYFEDHHVYKHHSISKEKGYKIAAFLLGYYLLLFFSRYAGEKQKTVYDMLWACNICIILSVYALITDKPILVGAALITISCDQLLWYFDILGYLLTRKFHIGVAKYLTWPEVPLSNKFTSTHHLWFMPLLGYVLKDVGGLHFEAFIISLLLTSTLWLLSRNLTPKSLPGHKDKHDIYFNINLSWELWKDIPVKWLQKFSQNANFIEIMLASLAIWNTLNFGAYLVLRVIINSFAN
jgi:hypothetical protein